MLSFVRPFLNAPPFRRRSSMTLYRFIERFGELKRAVFAVSLPTHLMKRKTLDRTG